MTMCNWLPEPNAKPIFEDLRHCSAGMGKKTKAASGADPEQKAA